MISTALSVKRYNEDLGIILSQFLGVCVAKMTFLRPPNEHQPSMAQSIGYTHPQLSFLRREADVGGAMAMYDDRMILLVWRLTPVWKA